MSKYYWKILQVTFWRVTTYKLVEELGMHLEWQEDCNMIYVINFTYLSLKWMPININIKKKLHVGAKSTRYNRGRVGINRNEGR